MCCCGYKVNCVPFMNAFNYVVAMHWKTASHLHKYQQLSVFAHRGEVPGVPGPIPEDELEQRLSARLHHPQITVQRQREGDCPSLVSL